MDDVDVAAGWLPDPEHEGRERYWNGSGWTDRVRPASRTGSLHLPEHVPELQRALAAATADIDAVEDRLSLLFDRTEPTPDTAGPGGHTAAAGDEDEPIEFGGDGPEIRDEDDSLAELDAALADEVPEAPPRRGLFRRRS